VGSESDEESSDYEKVLEGPVLNQIVESLVVEKKEKLRWPKFTFFNATGKQV